MNIRKFAYSLAIVSALIAGFIVVMADWKNSAFRSSAKSIAVRKLQPPKNPLKNLHGGLRGEKRGLHIKPKPSHPLHAPQLRHRSAAKSIAACRMHL